MSPSLVANGGVSSPAPRVSSVYSEVQTSRIDHQLPLPSVLKKPFRLVDGPASSAAGNPEEIAKLFPNVFGQPSAQLVACDSNTELPDQKLKIGVVLSGGQAPGGHNVISGIFDYLQDRAKGSIMYGFRGGPAGIMKCKYIELTPEYAYPYRNQGGFDMICSGRDKIETPEQNLKTWVIGCPKTVDGGLKCKEVPTSFGFDTACKNESYITLRDLKGCKLSGSVFNILFYLNKFMAYETRDPFLIRQERENPTLT